MSLRRIRTSLKLISNISKLSLYIIKRSYKFSSNWQESSTGISDKNPAILLLYVISNRRPILLNCNGAAQISTAHFFIYNGAISLLCQNLVITEDSWPHSDTPHSVGLHRTDDQSDAETSTWQHTILTRDRHSCPRRDSNLQSQQSRDRRSTP
jgi:hypothetical protein